MQHPDFMDHLARKGVLRDPQGGNGSRQARAGDAFGNLDWVGLTRLTPPAFADEPASLVGALATIRHDLALTKRSIEAA